MPTIKVACPKCGQKVSGDESFFGTTVECPVCSSDIEFPGERRADAATDYREPISAEQPKELSEETMKISEFYEAPPQALSAKEGIAKELSPIGESEPEESDEVPSPLFGAIAIVTSILNLVTCGVAGVILAPVAIICGHTALAKAKHSPVRPAPGQTLGAVGLIIGYISLIVTILLLLVLVFFGDTLKERFLS